ncbi:MAG: hypothetical protein V1494_05410 [Candidatus Diapherotrites archaeon]
MGGIEKQKKEEFKVDFNKGEKYYQIHVFENSDGSAYLQISSKLTKDGKIETVSRGIKDGAPFIAKIGDPCSKEDFKKSTKNLKKNLQTAGFTHKFIDLSKCKNLKEISLVLAKSDPRFKISEQRTAAI